MMSLTVPWALHKHHISPMLGNGTIMMMFWVDFTIHCRSWVCGARLSFEKSGRWKSEGTWSTQHSYLVVFCGGVSANPNYQWSAGEEVQNPITEGSTQHLCLTVV